MSNNSTNDHPSTLIHPGNRPKRHWRRIFLVFQATRILNSITNNIDNRSLMPDNNSMSTLTCTVPPAHDEGICPTVPQPTSEIQPDDCENQFPMETIARIVNEEDFSSLTEFGGVQGTADALNTHLENGIPGDTEDLHQRSMYSRYGNMQPTSARTFLVVLWGSSMTLNIILLINCGYLSLGFGIKEEGPKRGWKECHLSLLFLLFTGIKRWYLVRPLSWSHLLVSLWALHQPSALT
ncbi:hypothetical protein Patl1_09684 [Pistacia atlantica]|uniref:Uncharacterized protein n=1 Tax=Pistacia atlantica TaxID=434234 RepID=A0ACC1A9I6_9ROSI|nr:hypothetical protein Patl1_09684 [Pistacia atlantica]